MIRWADDRLGSSGSTRKALKKIFPDHWSFLLGEIALFTFVILLVTGIFLTLFFKADQSEVVYLGPYEPLQGHTMSAAFASTLKLSFEVKLGMLIRQMHHWAALVFVAAIVVHMSRVFFTGAFRRPRELNWIIGINLIILSLLMGFSGYSLPDDLLSGIGLRIAYSIVLSIPFVGPRAAFLLFGGEWPTQDIIARLFVLHVMLLPWVLMGLIGLHLAILYHQKHTQFPGPGKTENNVVGKAFFPYQVLKSTGLMIITAAVIALLAGLVQVNPVWAYGPYDASLATVPSQPDWYMGWLEGTIRIFPAFEPTIFGVTIPMALLFPAAILPGIVFTVIALWPWIERRITGDVAEHNLLDVPRQAPVRTGCGVAGLAFMVVYMLAGGNDVLALMFNVPVELITWIFRVAFFVVPPFAGYVAYKMCVELAETDRHPFSPSKGIVLKRNPEGGFQ
ncbi:ubiquinol-cytochrome c reductase cytochrome b subunit [soil metagenome]